MSKDAEHQMKIAVQALEEKKAADIVVLNLQGISLIADYFVICHGQTEIQVQAITNELKKQTAEKGIEIKGIEGYDKARWVLVDLGDVVVHIFHKEDREYYHIERLWSDATVVEQV